MCPWGASRVRLPIRQALRTQARLRKTPPANTQSIFSNLLAAKSFGPYAERGPASNDVVSLLRQHFDQLFAKARGLKPVPFANGDTGWFFPDGIAPGQQGRGRAAGRSQDPPGDERKVQKAALASLPCRQGAHLAATGLPDSCQSGLKRGRRDAAPGRRTHVRRRRLTRSWWNNIWRDRLLAAMQFFANGQAAITLTAGRYRLLNLASSHQSHGAGVLRCCGSARRLQRQRRRGREAVPRYGGRGRHTA